MTTRRQRPVLRFAVCVNTEDPDLLIPRRVYQVLPDESAARSEYVRVVDNEGEDYLYPASFFIFVDLPPALERTLLRSARAARPGAPRKRALRSRSRSWQPS
jgi:hypothetical protein